jgi:hypothetical protein
MTPEERTEMRRHEKAVADEVLAVKLAVSAEMNAMTLEERLAESRHIAAEYRARRLNVVS